MNSDYYFKELLKKFKSELERKKNYINDWCFPPFKRLNHLEVLKEVRDLCDCARDEIRKKPEKDRKAYLKKLKNKHEELIKKPLFNLIDEVYYYYPGNAMNLHSKGILRPSSECSEDFINEHQAIKTYRYHLQATDKDVICDYAFVNEIWNRIAKTVEWEIEDITPPQTPKEEISV